MSLSEYARAHRLAFRAWYCRLASPTIPARSRSKVRPRNSRARCGHDRIWLALARQVEVSDTSVGDLPKYANKLNA